jgi:hypothetical protein
MSEGREDGRVKKWLVKEDTGGHLSGIAALEGGLPGTAWHTGSKRHSQNLGIWNQSIS